MAHATSRPAPVEAELPLDDIEPNPNNRAVAQEASAGGEDWEQFVDSIRVRGITQRLEVCRRADGKFELVDGERRWRGAKAAGLERVPARVWPEGTRSADLVELGLIINVHRREHGCLEIARRLRELKNVHAVTPEELARRTGLKVDKVRLYLGLFDASDELLALLEKHQPSLRVAVELVRFQRRHGESAVRRLLAKAGGEPLTVGMITGERTRRAAASEGKAPSQKIALSKRILSAFQRDGVATLAEVEQAVGELGYRLVPVEDRQVARAEKPSRDPSRSP